MTDIVTDRSDTAEDMALCVLDSWRLDDRAPTSDELIRRYGFDAALVAEHGAAAIAAGTRLYEMREDEKKAVTHSPPRGTVQIATGNGAAMRVRVRVQGRG